MRVPGELKAEGALSNRMPVIDVRMLERRANEGGYERRSSSRTLALCLIFRCGSDRAAASQKPAVPRNDRM